MNNNSNNKKHKNDNSICCLAFCPYAKTSPVYSFFDPLHRKKHLGRKLEGCKLEKRIRPSNNEDVRRYCPLNKQDE